MSETKKLIWKEVDRKNGAYEVRYSDFVGIVDVCPRGEFTGANIRKWTVHKKEHLIALGYCDDNDRAEKIVESVIDGG